MEKMMGEKRFLHARSAVTPWAWSHCVARSGVCLEQVAWCVSPMVAVPPDCSRNAPVFFRVQCFFVFFLQNGQTHLESASWKHERQTFSLSEKMFSLENFNPPSTHPSHQSSSWASAEWRTIPRRAVEKSIVKWLSFSDLFSFNHYAPSSLFPFCHHNGCCPAAGPSRN